MYLHLKLCVLNAGDEASLPPYLHQLTGKHISESIKDNIITRQLFNTEYCDGHINPLPVTLLNTIKKINNILEYPYITYRTAHKGLTLLGVSLLDEDEILSINKLHKYVSSASLT